MMRTAVLSSLSLAVVLTFAAPAEGFIRGDVDGGGNVDIGDAIAILGVLFVPGSTPIDCDDAADANDDGIINLADPIFLLGALFQPGAAPIPPPFPSDGVDPTPDSLTPCDVLGVLPCTTLSQGPNSGITTFTQDVITDATDWTAFWTQHSSDPLPTVDFDNEMVIAILGTYDNGGVTYNIDEVEAVGNTLEIRYTLVLPGVFFPVVEQPHHFVRCPKVLATPVWVETVIALP